MNAIRRTAETIALRPRLATVEPVQLDGGLISQPPIERIIECPCALCEQGRAQAGLTRRILLATPPSSVTGLERRVTVAIDLGNALTQLTYAIFAICGVLLVLTLVLLARIYLFDPAVLR